MSGSGPAGDASAGAPGPADASPGRAFMPRDSRRATGYDLVTGERAAAVRAATERDRETYTQADFAPVECRRCGGCVRVRKNSPKHTSIQWTADAVAACPTLTAWRDGAEERPQGEDTCPSMLASIRYAYAEGLITLAEGVDPRDEDHMVNPLYRPS